MLDEFIELNRDFHPISKGAEAAQAEDFETRIAFGLSSRVHWDDLLKEPRVVILAEAGAGKTYEIQGATKRLRAEGKQAFFLRLEYLRDDFEMAFEGDALGEFSEFQAWIKTIEKAWLFLDSVDEAKLRDPGDFEKGLRKLKLQLGDKAQQVNIVITSRLTWEPKTELSLVERLLPYRPEKQSAEKNETDQNSDHLLEQSGNADVEVKDDEKYPKIYSLAPLNDDQIKAFSVAKGVTDTNSLLEAIGRADAGLFASRPQDLTDLVNYWTEHRTIGTRLELVKASVKQKLVESDPTRSELKPLTYEKALAGAELIAAVVTLTPFSRVAVPDKEKVSGAIPIADILPGWTPSECKALLERPIFDEAVYGTIRFHHRSVREYLAAQWILRLLDNGSRRQVENLFFRVQYEEDVLTPTLRPILPWVAIFDDQFRQKALRIAPEVLLEGGDPSQFPASVRSKILETLCRDMAVSKNHHHSFNIAAVERFSNSDIEQTVSRLIDQYNENSEIRRLLLRMVWQGELGSCAGQAMPFVKDKAYDKYTRIYAIRAIEGAGTASDKQQVVEHFVNNTDEIDYSIINTVVESFGFKELSVSSLLVLLDRLPNPGEFNTEGLDYTLERLIETVPLSDLEVFIESLSVLLAKEPHIERIHCDVSQQHAWLIAIVMKGCERLINKRSTTMLNPSALGLLSQCGTYRNYHGRNDLGQSLAEIVPQWCELNEWLFWYDVARTRADRDNEVTEVWQISAFGHYWHSEIIGFETTLDWIATKSKMKDKRIALSIAYDAYVRDGRNRKSREVLKETVSGIPELEGALQNYLKPPSQSEEQKKWRRQERNFKRRQKQREEKQKQQRKDWKAWLSENTYNILDTQGVAEGKFSKSQLYLHHRLRHLGKDRNRRTYGNWRDLIKDQSREVAEAYRIFLMACWRQYRPAICSEEIENPNSVPDGVIFGLSGLSIDMTETPNWPSDLTRDEAEHVARYSLWELNGFPDWLPQLHASFPKIVEKHLLREIEWELTEYEGDKPCQYVLDTLVWHGEWVRGKLGSSVLGILQGHEPKHTETLQKSLENVFDSEQVNDDALAALAQNKIGQPLGREKHAVWFAVWVALNPQEAIPKLEIYLAAIADAQKATEFAMRFVVNLMGGRRSSIQNIREKFKQAEYLEKLYLLTAKYVRILEDIDRAGKKGSYSPVLRDDAQDARNSLFSILKEIPGKPTFLALKRIVSEHPDEKARFWMQTHVKNRAEQDADIGDWSVGDVIDFANNQERQPGNAKQLYELSVSRLLDLKNELENADDSVAGTWKRETEETKLRVLIAKWLRDHASRKYSVHQEEEQADAKRPDIRTHGYGFDTPVPIELKIADNKWTGSKLFERLENQLCNDYLRDYRTTYGIFLLVWRGEKQKWENPTTKQRMSFDELVETLQQHAQAYILERGEIDDVSVIGVDLTKRLKPVRLKT
jgi:hypothetical protein